MTGIQLLNADGDPLEQSAYQHSKGAYHAAGIGRQGELARWNTTAHTADSALLPTQEKLNARALDAARNSGYTKGGIQQHIDMMVGHQWKLSYKPNYRLLGISPEDSAEFARDVEAYFTDIAEDPECYLDAEGKRTFTMMAREVAGTHCIRGEVFSKTEHLGYSGRPISTAIKMIDGFRICNPENRLATPFLRNGVRINQHGAARGYHIRTAIPSESQLGEHRQFEYKYYPRRLPWGRMQIIHVFEPEGAGQTRGGNKLLSVLSKIPMLNKLQDATLQNAIINAMYAAVVKSNVDAEVIKDIMGGNQKAAQNYMMEKAAWHDHAGVTLDGMKMPHLFLNEEIDLLASENPGAGFGEFEGSILRDISAGLGLSYHEFSRNFSDANYSTIKAAMAQSWRHMRGGREVIVKRWSRQAFALVLEEALAIGKLKLPKSKFGFYDAKSAWTKCDFIGAGKIHIDGLKEVKESVELLTAGLSTYEIECAKLGQDYSEILDQQLREQNLQKKIGQTPLWLLAANKAKTSEHPQTNTNDVDQDK